MGFIFGAEGLPETPEELARMRAIAGALQKRRTPKNVGEGIAALGQGIASGLYMRQANNAEKAGKEGANNTFSTIVSALTGGGSDASSVPVGGGVSFSGSIPAEDLETDPVNRRINQGFAAFGGEGGSNYADAIASIESAGSGDYAAVGPQTGNGRAYGRYQVMDFNVGPWSEKHFGKRLTPQEFLANPEAQDAVFNGEFGSYVQKYGNPQDAASMWFTGRPADQGANRADVNGMTGSRYVDKFTKALGTQTASLNPSITPEQPAIDPKAVLAQRLTKLQGQGVSANPVAEEPQLAQAAPSPGVQRVAQAQQGMDQQTMQIIEAMNNPFMKPGQKAVLGAILNQRMQSNDPLRQMQLEKGRLELDQMRNPTTDDINEYNLAKSQGYQGSFVDFMTTMKKAGSQNTTVNVGQGSSEYNKAIDKKFAEQYIQIQDGAQSARNKLSVLTGLNNALSQSGYTGAGAESILALKQAGRLLGFDVGDLSNEETARALGNQFALQLRNPSGGAGMPGAMSDKDREFLVASVPGLTKTPEGNRKLIEYMTRVEQRSVEVAEMAQAYSERNGQIDNGFFQELSQWSAQNPLFSDEGSAGSSSLPSVAPGAGGGLMDSIPQMTREDLQGLDRSQMSLEELKAAAERYRQIMGGAQ